VFDGRGGSTVEALDRLIASSKRLKAWRTSGVSEDVIADAERVLGVVFPTSYRSWLATYGTGYLDGYELQGLFDTKPSERDPSDVLSGDVVFTTQLNRQSGDPLHLIELVSYEGDEVYYLDLSRGVGGEAPVVCRDATAPAHLKVDAQTFEAFLRKRLQESHP